MAYARVIRLADRVAIPAALADNAFMDAARRAEERLDFAQQVLADVRRLMRTAAGTEAHPYTATDADRLERLALQEGARAKSDLAEARRLLATYSGAACDDAVALPGHGWAA